MRMRLARPYTAPHTMSANVNYDFLVKTLLIGDSGVGKTAIMKRFTDGTFEPSYISTIGVDFAIRNLDIEGKRCKIQVWDTAGQERFRNITSAYYRGAHAIVIVFDVTSQESFRNVRFWLTEVARYASDDARTVLCANKTDMASKRVVDEETVQQLADELQLPVYEVSAKSSSNIDDVFTSASLRYLNERARTLAASYSEPLPAKRDTVDMSSDSNSIFRCCRMM